MALPRHSDIPLARTEIPSAGRSDRAANGRTHMLIAPAKVSKDAERVGKRANAARICVVYLLLERRNAWHSTKLNQYSSSEPLFTDFQAAALASETRRKAGSYFVISGKLALAFDFGKQSVVVVNLNTSKPFVTWSLPLALVQRRSPLTPEDVFRAFSPSYFGHCGSGWNVDGPEPTIISGVARSDALSSYVQEKLPRWVSQIKSGKMLYSRVSGGKCRLLGHGLCCLALGTSRTNKNARRYSATSR